MASTELVQEEEKVEPLLISPEEYLRIEELVEVRLEYANGKVIPKEGSEPLPDWVVRELLHPDFDEKTLDFEFPMATRKHAHLIRNIQRELTLSLQDNESVVIYGQDPQIYIALTGKYRVPDVTISPEVAQQKFEKNSLTNPIAIFEVLSPSTAPKDHSEKLDEYLSIESLQEYFLVSQDEVKIERYRRAEGKRWEYEAFREEPLPVSSVALELDIEKVYKDVF